MTTQDIITVVGSLGFPVVLVLGGLWFVYKALWPWLCKRVEAGDKERGERHAAYMAEMGASRKAMESMASVMTELAQRIATGDAGIVEIINDEVVPKLDAILAAVDNDSKRRR